jgi:hypothetical protein
MATTMSGAPDLPHYLRRKAGDQNATRSSYPELQRSNSILHDRIVRMHRDKLCQGCARFDWVRTHLYTRDVRSKSKKEKDKGTNRKVRNDLKRPLTVNLASGRVCDLSRLEDSVIWSEYEVLPEAPKEAGWSARNPRFKWQVQRDKSSKCMLCTLLWDAAREAPGLARLPRQSEPTYLDIELSGGPVFEQGGQHQCIEVGSHERS